MLDGVERGLTAISDVAVAVAELRVAVQPATAGDADGRRVRALGAGLEAGTAMGGVGFEVHTARPASCRRIATGWSDAQEAVFLGARAEELHARATGGAVAAVVRGGEMGFTAGCIDSIAVREAWIAYEFAEPVRADSRPMGDVQRAPPIAVSTIEDVIVPVCLAAGLPPPVAVEKPLVARNERAFAISAVLRCVEQIALHMAFSAVLSRLEEPLAARLVAHVTVPVVGITAQYGAGAFVAVPGATVDFAEVVALAAVFDIREIGLAAVRLRLVAVVPVAIAAQDTLAFDALSTAHVIARSLANILAFIDAAIAVVVHAVAGFDELVTDLWRDAGPGQELVQSGLDGAAALERAGLGSWTFDVCARGQEEQAQHHGLTAKEAGFRASFDALDSSEYSNGLDFDRTQGTLSVDYSERCREVGAGRELQNGRFFRSKFSRLVSPDFELDHVELIGNAHVAVHDDDDFREILGTARQRNSESHDDRGRVKSRPFETPVQRRTSGTKGTLSG